MAGLFEPRIRPPSGHVFRVVRRGGPVWYAKYRLPNGRQHFVPRAEDARPVAEAFRRDGTQPPHAEHQPSSAAT